MKNGQNFYLNLTSENIKKFESFKDKVIESVGWDMRATEQTTRVK